MLEELWTRFKTLYKKEVVIKTIPKKEMQKAKWLPEEAIQIAVKRREAKGKVEKER